ncbi:HEAT repeat domain-containing protein [Gemmatimonas sp.]
MAALALLLKQMRERAPTAEMLGSVQRLATLAQVGSVTIDDRVLDEAMAVEAVASGAAMLRTVMGTHGLSAIDIASTVTEAEFLKLGGLLVAPPSAVHGAIIESADALAIWNIRLRVPGMTLRPTPVGMRAIAPDEASLEGGAQVAHATHAAPLTIGTPAPIITGHDVLEHDLANAVRRGDGVAVFELLSGVTDRVFFEQLATPDALQLVVERLLEHPQNHEAVHDLLVRAGVPGARAVFEQLVAATEIADRRFLYDVAASLPATLAVARQYANDPTWYVARNAAGLLGESRSQSAVVDLARLLRHTDTRVRVAAVVALGQIGGPGAMARLESVLFDAVPDVRNRALSIVFAAPDADPLADRMMLAVQEESTLEYQLEIIAALSNVHTPRARQKLIEMTMARTRSLDDLQIRLAAIGALGTGHRPAADAVLRDLANDEHSLIRERAAAALAR